MCSKRRSNGKKFHPLMGLMYVVMIVAFVLAIGWVVMFLWNMIIPDVTGYKPLTYWQAVGLLVLFKILFGGFGRRRRWKNRGRFKKNWMNMNSEERRDAKEKWMNMNHDERKAFKQKWKDYCRGKRRESDK